MHSKFTVFLLTFSILTALMLPVSALLPTESDAALYDSVIRLHVLANSDTDADQTLKLAVRDGILDTVAALLCGITDRQQAESVLRDNLAAIETAAREVLVQENSDNTVAVTLTEEAYPTRAYESVTLPAGTYTSLRVMIGKAAGQNWWCVLFPQLCVTAVPDEELLIEAGLTSSQIRLITGDSPDVIIKFRLLEWLSSVFS